MKTYLTEQSANFSDHLAYFKRLSPTRYDFEKLRFRVDKRKILGAQKISQIDASPLFNYKIFPPNIMLSYAQWVSEKRKMRVGDTVVQEIYIPPCRVFSQKILVGVRVTDIIEKPNILGFSYETLEGHVEKGHSTFQIEEKEDGICFNISTYSAPNGILPSLFAPFSRLYQAYCTNQALNHFVGNLSLLPKP